MKFDPSVISVVKYRNYVIPWKKRNWKRRNVNRCTVLVHLLFGTTQTDIQTKVIQDGTKLCIFIQRAKVLLSVDHVIDQCRQDSRVERVEAYKTAIDKVREPIDSSKAACL